MIFPLIVIFVLGAFVRYPHFALIILMFFGLLDGSVNTIAQYWITSAARDAPEFANGIFLFVCNASIFIGTMIGGIIVDSASIIFLFVGSIMIRLVSIPFVLFRIKAYPDIE